MQNTDKKLLLAITVGGALVALFAPPFLSGSNHACPVLREEDLKKGPSAQAVPLFARKYNVDCTYCHTAWPQLNRTGYIFRKLGYRMPYEVPTSSGAPSTGAPSATAPPVVLPPGVNSGLKNSVANAARQVPTEAQLADGKKTFEQMQCFTCHANGDNVINPAKPIKGAKFLQKYPEDAQIAKIIRQGVSGTAMPAYAADRLSEERMTGLIAYVRSLTPAQEP